jgi:hypothetical protein
MPKKGGGRWIHPGRRQGKESYAIVQWEKKRSKEEKAGEDDPKGSEKWK